MGRESGWKDRREGRLEGGKNGGREGGREGRREGGKGGLLAAPRKARARRGREDGFHLPFLFPSLLLLPLPPSPLLLLPLWD
jgi:hypothetical protein